MAETEKTPATQEEPDALNPEKGSPPKPEVKVNKAGRNAGRDGRSEAAAARTT